MKDKKQLRSIRLEPDVDAWIKAQAQTDDRSINAQINRLLRRMKEMQEQPAVPQPVS